MAQLVEQLTVNQWVTGSSPVIPAICWCGSTVEQLTCNQQVVGSIPIASSIIYGSLVKRLRHHPFTVVTGVRFPYGSPIPGTIAQLGEHLPYKQGVTGSSPVSPTIYINAAW